jgi:hypothetical protein
MSGGRRGLNAAREPGWPLVDIVPPSCCRGYCISESSRRARHSSSRNRIHSCDVPLFCSLLPTGVPIAPNQAGQGLISRFGELPPWLVFVKGPAREAGLFFFFFLFFLI